MRTNGLSALEKSGRTEEVRCEVRPRTGGVVHDATPHEVNDANGFPLGERQFFEFAFSLIGFRLAVGRTRQLVMGMDGVGRPFGQAIIGARRAYELHHAQGEQEKNQTEPHGTDHHPCPRQKRVHRTMSSTRSAIPGHLHPGSERKSLRIGNSQPSHAASRSNTGGIPSRPRSRAQL